jgi:hypothetical protein
VRLDGTHNVINTNQLVRLNCKVKWIYPVRIRENGNGFFIFFLFLECSENNIQQFGVCCLGVYNVFSLDRRRPEIRWLEIFVDLLDLLEQVIFLELNDCSQLKPIA